MPTQSLTKTLRAHIESHYPVLYLLTYEENEADSLIKELCGDRKILEWNMARGIVNFTNKQPQTEWCDLATALENFIAQDPDNHFIIIRDAHLGLRDQPLAVARLKALVNRILADQEASVTVFLISSQSYLPPELEKFTTLFELPLPDEKIIRTLIAEYAEAYAVTITEETLGKMALALQGLTRYEVGQLINRGYQRDGHIGLEDLDLVQTEKAQIIRKSGILEMLTVQEKLDDIGGLDKLKPWLRQKANIMSHWHEALAFGVESPKGVMIVGMPGCGKSLTAKATATLFKQPLLKLDMGSLMGKYVGESEANMRRAIQVAEAVSPCVLWVDEVEKAFVGVGSGGDGSEVATRLFGYFLTWMQEKTKPVFVVATANDIAALPPELLRKGRFDEIFYVDFPNETERAEIFRVHLSRRNKMNDNIDINRLAKNSEEYSGADIESIIKEAIEQAFSDGRVPLTTQRLLDVIQTTHPLRKVMKNKVEEYEAKFKQMCINTAS